MNYLAQNNKDSDSWKIWIESESPRGSTDESSYEEAWWLEITTNQPDFEYFFGPFPQKCDVAIRKSGFIKDLYDEGATNIQSDIRWCRPTEITTELRTSA